MNTHTYLALLTLPILASFALAQGPACAGLEQHAFLAAGEATRADVSVPAGSHRDLMVHGNDATTLRVRVTGAQGKLISEQFVTSSSTNIHLEGNQDLVFHIELQNLGNVSSSFVVQVW